MIVPEGNRKDIEEIPAQIKDALTIRFVDGASKVLLLSFVRTPGVKKAEAEGNYLPIQQTSISGVVQ